MAILLEVGPLDLGADVRAVGMDLVDAQAEPVRGAEAAAVWSRALNAITGEHPWALDFFSHIDRVRPDRWSFPLPSGMSLKRCC
jgi:hypothetical protein